MRKIVAIGGGSVGFGAAKPEVTSLSREIIKLSGKIRPRLLFLPTASGDDKAYIRAVEAHFRKLGCWVETLTLWKAPPRFAEIQKRLFAADIIYVGGGNTLKMIGLWKRLGVDRLLIKAQTRGKVLCGTSAGAICWFTIGNSDSRKYKNPKAKLIRVSGLGLLEAMACPHYNVEKDRRPELKRMTKAFKGMAIALDNCAAFEVVGERCRVITSQRSAQGYRVYWHQGRYREIPIGSHWQSIHKVLKKS
jgi:dipeptidase E